MGASIVSWRGPAFRLHYVDGIQIQFQASFRMVVFDPPHLLRAGESSWLAQKYGKLNKETWRDDLKQGFNECFRVLEPGGFLIFKWNEDQVKVTEVARLFPVQPLFGQRGGKTHWLVFMKGAGE